jgi:hypothetical protein
MDSFEEILKMAKSEKVDMLLLGGQPRRPPTACLPCTNPRLRWLPTS